MSHNRTIGSILGCALLFFGVVGDAAKPAAISLEDQQQILDVISAYGYAYDGREIEAFLALLTSDCTWEVYASGATTPMVRAASRDELRAIAEQRLATLQQKGIQSRHYQTNTLLIPRADGQIDGTTMLNLMWQVPGEKPYSVTTGIYRDVFAKQDGVWKIKKRTLLMDQRELGK